MQPFLSRFGSAFFLIKVQFRLFRVKEVIHCVICDFLIISWNSSLLPAIVVCAAWAAACLVTYCVQVAWKLSKMVFPQRLYGEREEVSGECVNHTAFQALITNLIPYFVFKRLIFYSNIFKNKLPRDCNLKDSYKPGVASTFYSVTQRQMKAWLFVSVFVFSYFEKGCRKKCTRQSTIGIVGGFEFTVLRRNLKEWHERPWTYVYEC